jgi:hypothetical protein
MAAKKVGKKCKLNPLGSFTPHTKIERSLLPKAEKKFAGSKSRNNMQKG